MSYVFIKLYAVNRSSYIRKQVCHTDQESLLLNIDNVIIKWYSKVAYSFMLCIYYKILSEWK